MCLALPAQVVSVARGAGPSRPAIVDFGGIHREVDLMLTPNATPGDYVVVHSGYALRVIPPVDALEALQLLNSDEAAPTEPGQPPSASSANAAIDV